MGKSVGKRLYYYQLIVILLYIIIMGIFPQVSAQDGSTTLAVDRVELISGETSTVNISLSNVNSLNNVSLNMSYNASVIAIDGINMGDLMDNGEMNFTDQTALGWASIAIEFSNDTNVSGSGIIASFIVRGIGGIGSSTNLTLMPLEGFFLKNLAGDYIDTNTTNGSVTIIRDNIPPSIAILSPLNHTHSSESINLSFSSDENLTWAYYSLDGFSNQSINQSNCIQNSCNISLPLIPQGPHSLKVWANDSWGNINSTKVYFYVDTFNGTSNIIWARFFGGLLGDISYEIIKSSGSGYLLSGSTDVYGLNTYRPIIIKIEEKGDYLWNATIDEGYNASLESIAEMTSKEILGLGYLYNQSTDIYLIKMNSSGDLIWSRTFGRNDKSDYGNSFLIAENDDIIICGQTYIGNDRYPLLMKLNSMGYQIWNRTFDFNKGSFESIIQTSDGAFLLGGDYWPPGAARTDALVVKVDENGTHQWNYTIGDVETDEVRSSVESSDGFYYLAGQHTFFDGKILNTDVLLLKFDVYGTLIWNKTYGETRFDLARDIQLTPSGNLMMSGISEINGHRDFPFFIVEGDGNLLWRYYYGEPDYSDEAYSLLSNQDGTYIATGKSDGFRYGEEHISYGGPSQFIGSDIFILKIDPPPTAIIYSPLNITYNNSFIELNLSFSENTSFQAYSIDGGENITLSNNLANFTVSNGQHNITIYANDSLGHMNSRTVYFSYQPPPDNIHSPASGGSSGGGGGSNEAFAFISRIEPGQLAAGIFSDKSSPCISEIQVTVNREVYSLGITIKHPSKKPYGTSGIKGIAYQYLEIRKSNSVDDESIEKALIFFKVEKGWLEKNDIHEKSISLLRFDGLQWIALETLKSNEDNIYVYYNSTTPGFSYFAIVGDSGLGFGKNDENSGFDPLIFQENMTRAIKWDFDEDADILTIKVENLSENLAVAENQNDINELIDRKKEIISLNLRISILIGNMVKTAFDMIITQE